MARDLPERIVTSERRMTGFLSTAVGAGLLLAVIPILKLSLENTNVRSLTSSLNQKRKVMFLCLDALANLRNAIEQEQTRRAPVGPR